MATESPRQTRRDERTTWIRRRRWPSGPTATAAAAGSPSVPAGASSVTRSRTCAICCQPTPSDMRTARGDVSAALERHTGAPAFLAYGTLLGALRERDLLEWSGDVDLTVSAAQAAQLARGPLHADLAARGIAPFFVADIVRLALVEGCGEWVRHAVPRVLLAGECAEEGLMLGRKPAASEDGPLLGTVRAVGPLHLVAR